MNDQELDKLLKQGRDEAGHFFGSLQSACKKMSDNELRKSRMTGSHTWSRVAAVALCVIAAGVCALVLLLPCSRSTYNSPQQTSGVTEQTVALGSDKEYRMNYIPTGIQDGSVPGIMTVLWETNGNGNQQMAYHSLFEYCDTIYPAMIIPFSGADYDMLLIASGDSSNGTIGYRLIGCNADAIQTWWSRDDIKGGKISVMNGVAVEKAADGSDPQNASVTYIVPIQIPRPGVFVLPVKSLKLGVGEQLLLIGSSAENMDAQSQNGLMTQMDPNQYGTSAVMFKAVGRGEDVLHIGAEQDQSLLSVSIGE